MLIPIFRTGHADYGFEDPIVIARAADFGGRSAKVKKAIEQFKADGEFAPLDPIFDGDQMLLRLSG